MKKISQRPNDILKSIEISFQEIQDFNKGKKKLKSLKESQQLWDKWAEEKCEWDIIADIFTNAAKKKGLTKEQVENIIEKIKKETKD
ncbi:hypothetical protein [Clostridium botulinum]|uniref:hypothetical protein n=1 Tax=Clostridium botulinum TaxID=1491 RepID=UPI0007737DF2|nr:hypothetical protein [Clostridium botulinum]MBN3351937.1 hypothetical protein [Clostridium botulinum]MBN3402976.1 hypothetical protein [Clostridium botulinum]MBN3447766.1 hypothetical protein [Clostridium botulinum]